MEKFEVSDSNDDTLKVYAPGGPVTALAGLFFVIDPDDGFTENVFVERETVKVLRDRLTEWLDETEPKLPTKTGAVIVGAIKDMMLDGPIGRRTLARVSGEGHVWEDLTTRSLYTDDEIVSFEVEFEGVSA